MSGTDAVQARHSLNVVLFVVQLLHISKAKQLDYPVPEFEDRCRGSQFNVDVANVQPQNKRLLKVPSLVA